MTTYEKVNCIFTSSRNTRTVYEAFNLEDTYEINPFEYDNFFLIRQDKQIEIGRKSFEWVGQGLLDIL